jgi:hypothetical protein
VPAWGGTFNGTTSNYGADLGTTTSTGSCTQTRQVGRDAVYQITLDPGQQLAAAVTSSWSSILYLVTDCANSATTCVAGSSASPAMLGYTNSGSASATYYLVVDAAQLSNTMTTREGPYSLTIEIY